MQYFFRMSVDFFKNCIKPLLYMYTKGFWVIFASYRKFGSKWIRGSVEEAGDFSPWSLFKSRLSSAESKRNVMFEKVKRWRLIKISQSIFPLIFFCLDCFVIILLLNYMWYPDEQELISVLFGLRQKASNITCSMNITDGVFKLPSALTWPL